GQRDAARSESNGVAEVGEAECVRAVRREDLGHRETAEAVAVRLDDREDLASGPDEPAYRPKIVRDGVDVDLEPGGTMHRDPPLRTRAEHTLAVRRVVPNVGGRRNPVKGAANRLRLLVAGRSKPRYKRPCPTRSATASSSVCSCPRPTRSSSRTSTRWRRPASRCTSGASSSKTRRWTTTPA